MNITSYLKSGYPCLAIETFEVKRARNNIEIDEEWKIYKWDMINGLNMKMENNLKILENYFHLFNNNHNQFLFLKILIFLLMMKQFNNLF